jgi:hypothetical protein
VAGHPNTSDTSLLRLSEDSAAKVRVTVANRNPVSPEVLMTIAHSRFFEYRRMVALNPSCPLDLLEKLSADPEPEVSKAAKNRLNCTSALPADTGQPYATTSPSPKARRQTQKLTPEVQAAVDAIKARPENSKRFQQQTPPVNPEAKIKLEHEQPLDELLKAAGITLPDPVEWNKKYPDPKP